MLLENWKSKQWDRTTHLLDWKKKKSNASEDTEQQEFSFTDSGDGKPYSCFQRQFGSLLN